MKRFSFVASAYLILIRDNKILLARRCNTGFEDGKYGLVAGHVDGNETIREALIREVKEESGLTLNLKNLAVVHVMHRRGPDDERIDFFIRANRVTGEPRIMEPDKCDDMGWFNVDELPPNTIKYITQAIKNIRANMPYSEFGW